MKKHILFLLLPLVLSCEKEIDIDYRETGRLYVAEATMTQTATNVRLTTTQSVNDDDNRSHAVDNATIVLTCKYYDWSDTLRYTRNGNYMSIANGEPGITYDLDIYVDGHHFASSSTMQEAPDVRSFRFVWMEMMGERLLYGDLRIQDDPDRSNYYFMHIYRNNVGYRWAVMKDEKDKGGELQQLFQCGSARDMDKGDSDALKEGDAIRIEVRAIDRASYDYLYSMQVMDNSGSNPIANFTGGCLGYFSAYNYVNLHRTFHRSEVEDE